MSSYRWIPLKGTRTGIQKCLNLLDVACASEDTGSRALAHPSGYQGIRWNDRNLVVLLPFMENTFMPVWEYWTAYPKDFQAAKAGVEPFASWLKLAAETIVPIPRFNPPKPVEVPGANLRDPISIVVVGGETLPVWYAGNFDYIASASVDKWK